MLNNKKIIVIMPAYNAEKTLEKTFNDIPFDIVDEVILNDDCSKDNTVKKSRELNIKTFVHEKNLGYGANQKTCYKIALENNADIIIMLHPDYQYDPKLIPDLARKIARDGYECAVASRFLLNNAKNSNMPKYKYYANRLLTCFQNIIFHEKLSEYHTGYRAFSADLVKNIGFEEFSNDFIFDNQMLAKIIFKGYKIAQVPCPAKYFKEASSISFKNSLKYGIGVIFVTMEYIFAKAKITKNTIFK